MEPSALALFFFCSFSSEGVFGLAWASLLISLYAFFCCSCAALSLFLFLLFVCPVGRPDRSILQKLFTGSPTRLPTRPPIRPRCSSNRVLFCSCSALLLLFCCSFAALLLSSICSCSALQQLFNVFLFRFIFRVRASLVWLGRLCSSLCLSLSLSLFAALVLLFLCSCFCFLSAL